MISTTARAKLASLLAALCLLSASAKAQTAQPEIDLKLFDTAEVDRSKGCTVALWQSNRDPEKDKFAYLFIEHLTGRNNARQPARIKIGGQAVTYQRVAVGGRSSGYGLSEYQLYKGAGADDFLILELTLGAIEGEAVDIESGTMSIVLKGRQVFRASVKGGAGCMTAPVPAPKRSGRIAAPAQGPALFDRYAVRANLVPLEITREAQKRFGCAPELMRSNAVGFAMSEESAIWQMTCERFAYQASSVFALVHVQMPGKEFRFLEFKAPAGRERSTESALLLNPEWNVPARMVTGISRGRAQGDCGTFERHKVTETGDFMLVEYREKKACDGIVSRPQDWPLVFKAN